MITYMDKLNILWTTTNEDTIKNMIAMYSRNAIKKAYWKEVNLIIWGGSAKLIGESTQIQKLVKEMLHDGVKIEACKSCADQYGVTETLEKLGLDVRYMGEPLTHYLKNDEKILSL